MMRTLLILTLLVTAATGARAQETPHRYLPAATSYRFGIGAGESELETLPRPAPQQKITLIGKGAQLLAAGQLTRAIAVYRQALAAGQQLALAHFGLATALIRADQPDEALSHYQRAIELRNGQFPEAHFNLALAFFHQGEYQQAIGHYQQAIKDRPNYPAAFNNLGLAYQATGDEEQAQANFQRAITTRRGHYPLARYNLARAFFNQGKFFPEAAMELKLAIKEQPNFPEAYLILGNIYLIYETKGTAGSAAKAAAYYQQAIKLSAGYALAHENLAIAYTKLAKRSAALSEYRQAFNLYKNYSPLLLENLTATITNRSSFYINDEFSRAEGAGRVKTARNLPADSAAALQTLLNGYEELADELKSLPDIRYCFGRAYLAVGDWRGAADQFAAAVALSQGSDRDAARLLNSIYQMML